VIASVAAIAFGVGLLLGLGLGAVCRPSQPTGTAQVVTIEMQEDYVPPSASLHPTLSDDEIVARLIGPADS
jgi:hypothetical protein